MQPRLLVSPLVSRTKAEATAGCRGLPQVPQATSALAAQIHRTAERSPEGFRRPFPHQQLQVSTDATHAGSTTTLSGT